MPHLERFQFYFPNFISNICVLIGKPLNLYCKIAPLLKIILPELEIDDSKHETKMPSIPNILIFFFSPHITTLHDSPTVVEEQN